jgi:hypothetical protein
VAIVGALIGLAAGLGIAYWRFRRASASAAYRPRLVKAL